MILETTKRWLPRYSLRALLAATSLLALLLWRQIDWLNQRRDCLAADGVLAEPDPSVRAPGLLWLFGESGYTEILAPGLPYEGGDVERERGITSLFPEADNVYVEIYCPPESFDDDRSE